MAVFNSFTFDGENSLDYGVYITGEAVYNAPERAVEMVSIPGKNGALALDQGRFENIEVTYPAGMFGVKQAAFAGRMRAMRNMLASRYNYVRLTDSYHPDEYRLGLYKSGLEASPVAMSSAGEFDITFNCKPQRFLTSGEDPVDTSELGGEVTTNRDPYLFRRSGGGSIGHDFDAEIDKLIGGTVAWNQLVPNPTTLSGSSKAFNSGEQFIKNHKYFVSFRGSKVDSSGSDALMYLYGKVNGTSVFTNNVFGIGEKVWNCAESAVSNGTTGNVNDNVWMYFTNTSNLTFASVNIIDLTALFGSAEIADYIYSLEQTTAGSGIAWLKSHGFLTKDYYAYNEGSLLSVKTSEHRTSGKNLLNPTLKINASLNTATGVIDPNSDNAPMRISVNKMAVIPNTQITVSVQSPYQIGNACVYDGSGNYLQTIVVPSWMDGSYTFSIPSGAYYFATNFRKSDNTNISPSDLDIQIEFGSTATEYEPYESHSYPLDSDLELRGKFKLDANNNLYAEGDIYPPSGEVSRKYRKIVLDGTVGEFNATNNRILLRLQNVAVYAVDSFTGVNCIADTFPSISNQQSIVSGTVGVYANSSVIGLAGGKTSLAEYQSYLSEHPVTVVYELGTPTTETAQPYASPQVVNPLGTEEYIDTRNVPVPVGHETKYGMSQLVLTNPTEFPSKPLLEVTGVGTFWLGDTLFTITGTEGQTIYIDCETGEAWKNVGGVITPANGLVTLNRLDFPELDPGDTAVMYGTGIAKVVVTPRWWII